MTDNEIIKALGCCSDEKFYCTTCPCYLHRVDRCTRTLMKDALDLIKRQEAEIEKMRKVVNADVLFVRRMSGKSQRAKEFIRIKTDLVKAEAIKEFAERLKKNSIAVDVSLGYGKEHYTDAVAVIEIDSLVKEMVGEQE